MRGSEMGRKCNVNLDPRWRQGLKILTNKSSGCYISYYNRNEIIGIKRR
jgi:hypothetical protein